MKCPRRARTVHSSVVVVRVRDQGQETRALDGGRELALVLGLGAGDAAGDDLAGLGQVLAQGVEILVVDLFHALGGELAELAAAEELCLLYTSPSPRDRQKSRMPSSA